MSNYTFQGPEREKFELHSDRAFIEKLTQAPHFFTLYQTNDENYTFTNIESREFIILPEVLDEFDKMVPARGLISARERQVATLIKKYMLVKSKSGKFTKAGSVSLHRKSQDSYLIAETEERAKELHKRMILDQIDIEKHREMVALYENAQK